MNICGIRFENIEMLVIMSTHILSMMIAMVIRM